MRTKNVCVALALMSAAACGGGGSTTPRTQPIGNTPPPTGGVSVTNSGYSPSAKTVAAGAAVQWAWNTCTGDPYAGQTCASHSVTFDDGVTSSTQDQGTYTRTFSTAGSYPYHCLVHGASMSGSVTVQ